MKYYLSPYNPPKEESRPARGAWVEILRASFRIPAPRSRPARGAWVEIDKGKYKPISRVSRPARGAWVEIGCLADRAHGAAVAPRKGRVG